jgi:hypothetical protein
MIGFAGGGSMIAQIQGKELHRVKGSGFRNEG